MLSRSLVVKAGAGALAVALAATACGSSKNDTGSRSRSAANAAARSAIGAVQKCSRSDRFGRPVQVPVAVIGDPSRSVRQITSP